MLLRRLVIAVAVLAVGIPAWSQSLEPRSYANAPVGMEFFVFGYAYSTGGAVLDPSVPIEDGNITIHSAVTAWSRSLAVAGNGGKVLVSLPYSWLSGSAILSTTGERQSREVSGLGDPLVRFSVNFLGAPALALPEFQLYRQRTIVGATLQVTAPLGRYDAERAVNIGTNRWSFKPEIGVSQALGRWIVEGAAAVTWFTDNDEFFGGQLREQDPLLSVQGHGTRSIGRRGMWVSFDATYYRGAQSTVNGVEKEDELSNWRYGATVAVPIDRANSIKIYASDGIAAQRGADFTLLGVLWQVRRGGAGKAAAQR